MTPRPPLSTLQRVLLIWLREDARWGPAMPPTTAAVGAALCPAGWHRDSVNRVLNQLEAQGFIRVQWSPGHQRLAIWITPAGQAVLIDSKE